VSDVKRKVELLKKLTQKGIAQNIQRPNEPYVVFDFTIAPRGSFDEARELIRELAKMERNDPRIIDLAMRAHSWVRRHDRD
jgi:hypothetical protein